MKKYVLKTNPVTAIEWRGIDSISELIEMRDGCMTNVLFRHDESVLIFDNAFNLSQYVTVSKGDYIVKDSHGNLIVFTKSKFESNYTEFLTEEE